MPTPDQLLPTQSISFSNHRKAQYVEISEETQDYKLVFESLDISSNALILLTGSIDGEMNGRMAQLFSRGIAAVAADLKAALISNGISSEINKLLGKGVADRNYKSPLVGVCESSLVHQEDKLESNHSHFVFIDSNSLNYLDIFNKLVDNFSQHAPILTVLVGGDELACAQVLHSVRQGIPVIIMSKTGHLADDLTALKQNPPEFIDNPMLAEIMSDGKLHWFDIEGEKKSGALDKKVGELQRLILRLIRGDTTLRQAWERFAIYDLNASRHQTNFRNIQLAILFLTVIGTGLALLQNSFEKHLTLKNLYQKEIDEYYIIQKKETEKEKEKEKKVSTEQSQTDQKASPTPQDKVSKGNNILIEVKAKDMPSAFKIFLKQAFIATSIIFELLSEFMRNLIILIPIMITALLAAANRFNMGAKWLLLRGSAQSVMREIFKYRARAEHYSDQFFATEKNHSSREEHLAERIKEINSALLQSDVNTSSLSPYKDNLPPHNCLARSDDGLSRLSPEQYLNYRLEDQYNYYVSKTVKLEKKFKQLQWAIYIVGGVGTLLAAIGMEVWIALTSALVAAFGAYLEYQQIEKTLIKYNKAALELNNVKTWWIALPASAQEDPDNIDALVVHTEKILSSEFSEWMQEMQNALSSLKEKQQKMLKNSNNLVEEKNEDKKLEKIESKQESLSIKP